MLQRCKKEMKYKPGLGLLLGLVWLVGIVAPAQGEEAKEVSLAFRSAACAAGEYITLGDLVELSPDLAQRYGGALIWSAPPLGQIYTLTREFLAYRLPQLGLKDVLDLAALPAAIQVRQTGVLLDGEKVSAAFRRYIQEHSPPGRGDLKIQVYPLAEPFLLPDNQVTLEMLPPRQGKLLGEVTLEMVVMRQGQPLKRLKVSGMVRLERQVVCAVKALAAQELVRAEDVQLCRRDVTELTSQDFCTAVDQVIGRTLARKLSPQEIFTFQHLSNQPLIKKGEEVTVVLEQDGMTITTKGVAREEGHQGRAIRMLNPKSKKEFQALVVDARTVQVKL